MKPFVYCGCVKMRLSNIGIIFFLFFQTILTKVERFRINYALTECRGHPHFVANCEFTIGGTTQSQMNLELDYLQKLKPYYAKISMFIWNARMKAFNRELAYEFNLCNFLLNGQKKHLVDVLFKNFWKAVKQSSTCPLYGHLSFRNVNMIEDLPAVLPEIKFKVLIDHFLLNKTQVLNLVIVGDVKRNVISKPKLSF